MNKVRLTTLLGIIGLSAFASGVFAQDETFGLSAEDNTVYNEAMTNSANFTSLSYDFTLDLAVSGLGANSVSANLQGSGGISTEQGGFSMEVNGDLVNGSETQPAALGVILVDNMIYLRLGDESTQWQGGTVEQFTNQFASGFAQGSGMDVNPEDIANGDMTGMQDALMSNPAAMQALAALSTLDVSQVVGRTRTDNGDIASFRTDVALGDLLASENFASVVGAFSGASGTDAPPMTAEQMQQTSAMMASLFADAQISLTQNVDTTTNKVSSASLEMAIPLAQMLTGGTEPGALALTFTIDLSGYDEPLALTAPENVQMMPATAASGS